METRPLKSALRLGLQQPDTRKGLPCLNVKVRHGFESITPEQWGELRGMAYGDKTVPKDSLAGLNAEWCQIQDTSSGCQWWNHACELNFEQAEETAKALFGKHVECFQDGRSGGWLVVKGLPDVEEWCKPLDESEREEFYLPSLKDSTVDGASFSDGTPLSDSANIFERWAFFAEVCAGLVKDVPYQCASLLALNVFPRLEGTRDVEFLRAWTQRIVRVGKDCKDEWNLREWDTETLAVPGKVTGHTDLVAYYFANTGKPNPADSIAYVGILNDPKGD